MMYRFCRSNWPEFLAFAFLCVIVAMSPPMTMSAFSQTIDDPEIVDGCSGTKPHFKWNRVSANDLSHYLFYLIEDGFIFQDAVQVQGSKVTLSCDQAGVQEGHTYVAYVTAVDVSQNESDFSNVILFTQRDNTPPQAPKMCFRGYIKNDDGTVEEVEFCGDWGVGAIPDRPQ